MGAPSGTQWLISAGGWQATVVQVGGGIRSLSVDARDVVESYPLTAMCDAAHGTALAPWPNRLEEGAYDFDGGHYQLPLTEPAKHNAIHGLLRWTEWTLAAKDAARVLVQAVVHPQPGYPWELTVRIEYRLTGSGLDVTTTAVNTGEGTLPYASGQHPYLAPGGGRIDTCTLTLPARTRIVPDDRGLPVGSEPVAGTTHDFTAGAVIGGSVVDSAFHDLDRDGDGLAWTRLSGNDGRTVAMWQDEAYPYVEVFTGDTLAPDRRRTGLGVEPMTAPPNAFRSGEHLIRLQPGESSTARWGVTLT